MNINKISFLKIKRAFIGLVILLGGIFPFLWIFSVSIQTSGGKYQFIPDITFEAYSQVFTLNNGEIIYSLLYSFIVSTISTFVAMFFALCSIYLVIADNVKMKEKRRIVLGSIGLYLLPVFLTYYGIKSISQVIKIFNQTNIQLFTADILLGYVISFILLLAMYTSSRKNHFEQLLLELGSRVKAFYYGVIDPNLTGTLVIAGITFTTIWSEFFLSNLITTTESNKPFSVVLQRFNGQYTTNYSVFAAGAIFSLLSCIAFFVVIFISVKLLKKIQQNKELTV